MWVFHFKTGISTLHSRGLQTFSMEDHIADILKTRGPKLTQIKFEVAINNVGHRVMLPKKLVISEKKKVIISLAATNSAVHDQIDCIEVALSRKHCAIHLFCNCEKGPAGRSLAASAL